jgi:O-methyltransferase
MERFALARNVYRKVWGNTPLPDHGRRIDTDQNFAREVARLYAEDDFTYERKYNLDQLFQLVLNIGGDVAECGVYKGGSTFFLARHIAERGLNKRLCLFDAFEGLSAPTKLDGGYWRQGALASTVDDVQRALDPLGPLQCVEFFRGWIPDRFTEVSDRHFCFVHIDVDLYQPTLDSIIFFYPRLEPGGIIVLDDYGFESCPGVTAAIDWFMKDKAEPIINLSAGGAFIVKKS